MKHLFKFIGYFILGLIIVITGVIIYFNFGTKSNVQAISIVPDNALVILETDNPSETMLEITNTNYWKSVIESNVLTDFKDVLRSYEQTVENNTWLKPFLKKQNLTFSLHTIHKNKLDYLIITDIKKYGQLDLIPKLSSILNIPVKKSMIDSCQVYSVYIKKYHLNLHLTTVNNLIYCSSSYQLLEQTIHKEKSLSQSQLQKKNEVVKSFQSDLFNIYTNNNLIQNYFARYSSSFYKGLAFSALASDFTDDSFTLEGYTSTYDSIASPFTSLKNSSANKRTTEAVIPLDVSWYLNFNINDFTSFYNHFLNQYSKIDPIGYQAYSVGIGLTQSYIGIDINKNILSWISGEIAVTQFKPIPNTHKDDFLVVVKAKNIADAKENLAEITKKIKHRTSFKYDQSKYKNYNINYLNIKGFFKIFMGGFLYDRSKPYYTIIDDFILFSNSSDILELCIDNYLAGNTLKKSKDFQSFMKNFNSKCQLTSFVNMPYLYDRLYYFGNTKNKEEIKKYRKIIQNLGWIGFQLFPEDNLLKTRVYAKSTEIPPENYKIESDLYSAEDLYLEEFENMDFKIELDEKYNSYNGNLYYYTTHPNKDQDSILIHEGHLENGILEGMWRSYYTSGNIKSTVHYSNNMVDGTAVFYYNNINHIIRSEIEFSQDKIDGLYTEFYTNGNIKVSIEFKDGIKWGNIIYYYRNGQIKTEGRYKKGKASGKWKYYSKSGQIINKENR